MMQPIHISRALAMALVLTPLLRGSSASFCIGSSKRSSTQRSEMLVHCPRETKKGVKQRDANGATALMSTTIDSDELPLSKRTKGASMMIDRTVVEDVSTIFQHAVFCFASAAILCVYEGFDCAYLKPETATIRSFPATAAAIPTSRSSSPLEAYLLEDPSWATRGGTAMSSVVDVMRTGTKGMGRGRIDRLDGWYQNTYFGYNENDVNDDADSPATSRTPLYKMRQQLNSKFFSAFTSSTEYNHKTKVSQNFIREIPSYNEIMEEHRLYRVPTWRRDNSFSAQSKNTEERSAGLTPQSLQSLSLSPREQRRIELGTAVRSVYRALDVVNQLKLHANDYNWDNMKELLESPILRKDLLEGCSILRGAVDILDIDARTEIGFDWGSCAWRHCGANADAQESLSELYNSVGMLEPFECLFVLDIVERSLRDILTVVPTTYHPVDLRDTLQPYIPYQRQSDANGYVNGEEGSNTIDEKFVNTLSGLRNNYN